MDFSAHSYEKHRRKQFQNIAHSYEKHRRKQFQNIGQENRI